MKQNRRFGLKALLLSLVPYALAACDKQLENVDSLSGGTGDKDKELVSFMSTGNSAITMEPSSLNFETVKIGQVATKSLKLRNISGVSVFLSSTQKELAPFALSQTTCPSGNLGLAAGESCEYSLRFEPQEEGFVRRELVVEFGSKPTSLSYALKASVIGNVLNPLGKVAPVVNVRPPSRGAVNALGVVTYKIDIEGADFVTLSVDDVQVKYTGTAQCEMTVSGVSMSNRSVEFQSCTGDGTASIVIPKGVARDEAGNQSIVTPKSESFIIDNQAPPPPTLTGQTITTEVRPSWLVVSGAGGSGHVRFKFDQPSIEEGASVSSGGRLSAATSLSEGSHTLYAQERDDAENWSSSVSFLFLIDSIPPALKLASTPVENTVVQSAVTLNLECEIGLPVSFAGTGLPSPLLHDCLSGSFSKNLVLSDGDGRKEISMSQVDAAGNATVLKRSFVKDSMAPHLTLASPAAGGMIRSHNVTLQGLCEGTTLVTFAPLVAGDLSASTSTACASGTYSKNLVLGTGDGAKNLMISQTDLVGNNSNLNVSLIVDTVAPALTITGPAAESSFPSGVTLTGFCENGLRIEFGGDIAFSTSSSCSGSYSQALSFSGADGAKKVRVTQTDLAGNVTTLELNLQKDSSAPVLSVTQSNGASGNGSLVVSGTCESPYLVYFGGAGLGSPAFTACTSNIFSQVVAFASPATEGARVVSFTQRDSAENVTAVTRNFLNDITPPEISMGAPTLSLLNATSSAQIVASISGATSATIDSSTFTLTGSGSATCVASFSGSGALLRTINVASCTGDGTVAVSIAPGAALDAAGNSSQAVGASSSIAIDNTPPSAPVVSSAILQSSNPRPTWTWASGAVVGDGNFRFKLDSADLSVGATETQSTTYTPTSNLSDGNHILSVQEKDPAGNWSLSGTKTVNVDTTAPGLVLSSTPAASSSAQTGVTLTGSCDAGITITLAGTGLSSPSTASCAGDGTFSQAVVFTAGEGSKTISLSQVDNSGNVTTVSRDFLRDNTGPTLTLTSPASGSTVASTTVTLQGSCESTQIVSFSGSGLSSATSVACGGSSFSKAITLTSGDGAKSMTLSQSDAAGNTSSFVANLQLDTTAPALSISSPAAGTYATSGVTLSGTCESGINVSIFGDVSAPTSTACSGTYSTALNFSAGEGSKVVSVSQTDAVGNASGPLSRSFIKDSVAPSLTLAQGDGTTANQAMLVSGNCESSLLVTFGGAGVASPAFTSCNSGSFLQSVTFTTPGSEGARFVTFTQQDYAGNSTTVNRTFWNDITPPVVSVGAPSTTLLNVDGSATITANFTAADSITLTGATVLQSSTGDAACSASVSGSSLTSRTITLSSCTGDGTVTVALPATSASDLAGNNSLQSAASAAITIDNTPPSAPIVTGPSGVYGSARPTWTWMSGASAGNATYRYKLDSSNLASGATTSTAITYTPASDLSDGSHTLYVQERDNAGNWSTSGSKAVVIDTFTPAAPTDLAVGTVTGSSVALSWVDNASTETGYELQICSSITNGSSCSTSSFTATGSTVSLSSDTQSYTWSSLSAGDTVVFRVRAIRDATVGAWITGSTVMLFGGIASVDNGTGHSDFMSQVDCSVHRGVYLGLRWQTVSTATGYTVYNSPTANLNDLVVLKTVTGAGTGTYKLLITGLSPNVSYTILVRANGAIKPTSDNQAFTTLTTSYMAPCLALGQDTMTKLSGEFGGMFAPSGVATDGTRLAITDYYMHRVVLWNTAPTGAPAQKPDIVLGQSNYTDTLTNRSGAGIPSDNGLRNPTGVFIYTNGGNTSVYVADSWNQRVLIWTSWPTTNGQPADIVLGQSSMGTATVNHGGRSNRSMWTPTGVYVANGKLFVTDRSNARVLIWNTLPTSSADNYKPADVVLGAANGTDAPVAGCGTAPRQQLLCAPYQVWSDGVSRIAVSDTSQNRVMIWDFGATGTNTGWPANGTAGLDAWAVLGPTDFTTQGPSSNTCTVGAAGHGGSPQGLSFEPITNALLVSFGSYTNCSYRQPWPSSGGGTAWSTTTGSVITLPNAASEHSHIHYNGVSSTLYTVAITNSRVLVAPNFQSLAASATSLAASDVFTLGVDHPYVAATSWESDPGWPRGSTVLVPSASSSTFFRPSGIATDGTRFVVVDKGYNRVLIWNHMPTTFKEPADLVLGQADFTSSRANRGGSVAANTLNLPSTAAIDNSSGSPVLYVADTDNHRVLAWSTWPTSNGQSADRAVGQANFTSVSGSATNSNVAVILEKPRKVLAYGSKLYIAGGQNWSSNRYRIVTFDLPLAAPTGTAINASGVIGLSNGTDNYVEGWLSSGGQSRLGQPVGMTVLNNKLLVSNYVYNSVVGFSIPISTNNPNAEFVIGQPNFTSVDPNGGLGYVSAQGLNGPLGLASSGNKLFVADKDNTRILQFNNPGATAFPAASVVWGQNSFTESGVNAGFYKMNYLADWTTPGSRLISPHDVATDGVRIFIVDTEQHRILVQPLP